MECLAFSRFAVYVKICSKSVRSIEISQINWKISPQSLSAKLEDIFSPPHTWEISMKKIIRSGFVSTLLFPFSIYSSLSWCHRKICRVQMLFICVRCSFPQDTWPGMSSLRINQLVFIYWKSVFRVPTKCREFGGEKKCVWSVGIVESLNSHCVLCHRLGLVRDTIRHDDISALQELTVWVRKQNEKLEHR